MSNMIELGFKFPSNRGEEENETEEPEDIGPLDDYAVKWQDKSDRRVQVTKPRKMEVTVDKKKVMVPNTVVHDLGGRANFVSPSKRVEKRLFSDAKRKEKEGKAKKKKGWSVSA
jgi:hypothetical protein